MATKTKTAIDKLMQKLNKPDLKQKVTFFRLLAVSQNAGLGIRESIVSIAKSEQHPGFKDMMEEMVLELTNG